MIRTKHAPELIRGDNRISYKIMRSKIPLEE